MTRLTTLAAALLLAGAMTATTSIAPGFVSEAQAQAKKMTKEERAAARKAQRAKRADCNKQAAAQKLRLIKKRRFVNACMKKAA